MRAMMPDLWFRNPDRCMTVLAQEGVSRITWTRQQLFRLRMDGIGYVRQFYMHSAIRPQIMLIGIQGTSEYNVLGRLSEPQAVYPTWSGKNDSWDDLVGFIEKPWGENEQLCSDKSIDSSLRPVLGQKHRVIIHNSPSVSSGVGKKFWLTVDRVQEDYPEVELFINGGRNFSNLFGMNWKAVDYGLCDQGDTNQRFSLPSGVIIDLNDAHFALPKLDQWSKWIEMLGFTVNEIVADQKRRYAFRIRAARWASKHFATNFRFHFKHLNVAPEEIDVSTAEYTPRSSRSVILRRKLYTVKGAEKILCDRCSIAPGCKVYRTGQICGLKESEMAELQEYFQSRNAGKIVDGLAYITRLQAARIESALEKESNGDELDPEVTKQMNLLFANGVKLAKLVDPTLAGPGTKVQVNVGTGNSAQVLSASNPKELVAQAVNALEAAGVERGDITPAMIKGLLTGMASSTPQNAIEAARVEAEARSEARKPKVIEAEVHQIPLPQIFTQNPMSRDDE